MFNERKKKDMKVTDQFNEYEYFCDLADHKSK